MSWLIYKDGDVVRSCNTEAEVERALRFIPGAEAHSLKDTGRLPSASRGIMPALMQLEDNRVKGAFIFRNKPRSLRRLDA